MRHEYSIWVDAKEAAARDEFKEIAEYLLKNPSPNFADVQEYHYQSEKGSLGDMLESEDIDWNNTFVRNEHGDMLVVSGDKPMYLYDIDGKICPYERIGERISEIEFGDAFDKKYYAQWLDIMIRFGRNRDCVNLLSELLKTEQSYCYNLLQMSSVEKRLSILDDIHISVARAAASTLTPEQFSRAICEYVLYNECKRFPDPRLVIRAYLYANPLGARNEYGRQKLREYNASFIRRNGFDAFFGDKAEAVANLASDCDIQLFVWETAPNSAKFSVSGKIILDNYYENAISFTLPYAFDKKSDLDILITELKSCFNGDKTMTSMQNFIDGLATIKKGIDYVHQE